jgi:hypothetical protein
MSSTIILSERSNTFKIVSSTFDDVYFLLKIIVKELRYESGKEYYDISYEYEFNGSNKLNSKQNNILKVELHPFYKEDNVNREGEIVYKNEMLTKMIEYLLMNDDELEIHTGFTTSQTYRINLMKAISLFWD